MAKKYPSEGEISLSAKTGYALEGHRYSQALELAKKHHAREASQESEFLLRNVYLAYADDLVRRGSFRDAHIILNDAERLTVLEPQWISSLATLRAQLGDAKRAIQLAEQSKLPEVASKIRAILVDRAISEAPGSKALLPPDLQTDFDVVFQAFTDYEKGNDELVKENLQKIGSQSPFLEWKLAIRGLIAYSTNEDSRAVENWQRLNPERLPAQLIAPFRSMIDPIFKQSLDPDQRIQIEKQSDQLLPNRVIPNLRKIRQNLTSEGALPNALKVAQSVIPDLKRAAPLMVTKIANCFYWEIVRGGSPEDLSKYQRLFGPHPDDPSSDRLQALIMEQIDGMMAKAHELWQKYEKWIANHPERWPSSQANRARAIIWDRMGENALEVLQEIEEEEDFPAFDFFSPFLVRRNRKPLTPNAEICFSKAMELAPDWPQPATKLFRVYYDAEKNTQAEKVAKELLKKFPHHLPTLEAASQLCERLGRMKESLEYARRALQTNPLDRRLRERVGSISLSHARLALAEGNLDECRAALNQAKNYLPGQSVGLLCLLSILEEKANNSDLAKKYIDEAKSLPNHRFAMIYRLNVEANRAKLPPARKKSFSTAFNESLTGEFPFTELIPLIEAVSEYSLEGSLYHGFKTHSQKIRGLLEKKIQTKPDEIDLEKLGYALLRCKFWRALRICAKEGQILYPKNPHFFYLEAEYGFRNPNRVEQGIVMESLRAAMPLIKANLEKYRYLKEMIDRRNKEYPWLTWIVQDRQPQSIFRSSPFFGNDFDEDNEDEEFY